MTRKPIQLLIWGDNLVALCDDGSMWSDPTVGWNKLDPIPGSSEDPHMSEVEPATPASWFPWTAEHSRDQMWAVDVTDESVRHVPGPKLFVRLSGLNTGAELWTMVRATDEYEALQIWRHRKNDEIEEDRIEIDGLFYGFLTNTTPF